MRAFFPLLRREIGFYFRTSIAYVVGVFFLLITGFSFWFLAVRLSQQAMDGDIAHIFFTSFWFWLSMLIVTPLLTMRLFAEENRMGTIETLMTAPVTENEVVLAKFTSAYLVFLLLWLPTLAYPLLGKACGGQFPVPPLSLVASSQLGVALIGAFFLSVGLLCSILTRHQVVAAMVCLAVLGLWLSSSLITIQFQLEAAEPLAHFIAAPRHMRDFATGILDSRTIVWYFSATVLLLFTATRILEAHRLR
ncbi:MAG: ABC transporter permease [Verrucomicrobiota bacterium]|jgi:ABC-2 type transport system permease protein|nr:ABC transporter permease [Verrucomicrobiota bacterium]